MSSYYFEIQNSIAVVIFKNTGTNMDYELISRYLLSLKTLNMENCKQRDRTRISIMCLILMTAFFNISCSGNSSNKTPGKDSAQNNKPGKEAAKTEVDLSVVATDACDCVSDFESALSDEAKELVIEASKNGGMDTITRAFSDKDKDIWSSEGAKARNCMKQLEKKYPGLRKASSADYKKALEEHCSEFAAAMGN